jgi:preprotein translocase subunit SecY
MHAQVNHNLKEDRMAFQGMQKLAAIVFALFQSVFFVLSGMYGPLASVGIVNAVLVMMQVTFLSEYYITAHIFVFKPPSLIYITYVL